MARGLPQTVRDNLEKCRAAAIASVDAYNRPGPRFRTAHYIVLIIIAWTALFHAIFYNRGGRPWYRRAVKGTGIRYVRIDGEPKHWDQPFKWQVWRMRKNHNGARAMSSR